MIDARRRLLKPGGTLVYCTCSLEPEEGEAQLAPALARLPVDPDPIAADEIGGLAEVVTPAGTLRTLPSHLAEPTRAPVRPRRLLRHAPRKAESG